MRVKLNQDYAKLRAGAYPDAGEQLGALVKAVAALIEGGPPPADAAAVIEDVAAVKAKFPKPEHQTKD